MVINVSDSIHAKLDHRSMPRNGSGARLRGAWCELAGSAGFGLDKWSGDEIIGAEGGETLHCNK